MKKQLISRRIGGIHGVQHRIGKKGNGLAGAEKALFTDNCLCSPLDPQGMTTYNATYASLVRWCGHEKALVDGRQVHARITASGKDRNTFLANLLVQMYGKCGSVEDAQNVFDKIGHRNIFSWNFMISVYAQNGCEPKALQLYKQMQMEEVEPNKFTFFPILAACSNLLALADGKQIHERIFACGFERDVAVRTALVNMYGKCGSLKDARAVFDKMVERDAISWNAMIGAYAQNGCGEEGLLLFRRMDLEGVKANRVTFLSALDACSRLASLEDGRAIHTHIIASGLDSDVTVRSALVNMYGKCGSPKDAKAVFEQTHERDVISWNAMIAAYVHNGDGNEAIKLFTKMDAEGVKPDKVTFLSTLDACARLASLESGRAIHECILASGLDLDIALRTALVNMYGKCGSVKDAFTVFDEMHDRDVISWTAMIAAYAQNGYGKEGLELFRQMDLAGIKPNRITFLSTLDACASLASLESGREMHERIVASGFNSDIAVRNALVNMYGKCSSLKDSQAVFDEMHERDVISWNSMIAAHVQNGHGKEGFELFRKMNLEGIKPNRITFLNILDACSSSASLENGRVIHECIVASGFDSDVALSTALVNMYGKCGSLKDAQAVFGEMHERDTVLWNAMMAAYVRNGHGMEALDLSRKMDLEGVKPDRVTFLSVIDACASLASLENGRMIHERIVATGFELDVTLRTALLNMYGKCGSLKHAKAVFDKMHERDLVSWNAMLAAYAQNGCGKEGLKLFSLMDLEGVKPDRVTFLSALDACASLASLENGRAIHEYIIASGFDSDVAVRNALVNMYGKCGSLKNASAVFNETHERDVISWNTMIAVYAQNGCGKEALELFRLMDVEGIQPDKITFFSVLSACSHACLLRAGWRYFLSMSGDYGIAPLEKHYVCMSDLLGRAGYLEEAEDLIVNMPVQPSAVAWTTLLGACRVYGNMERGACAAEHVYELDPENASPYVLLSNIYAAASKWGDAAMPKKAIEERGVKK